MTKKVNSGLGTNCFGEVPAKPGHLQLVSLRYGTKHSHFKQSKVKDKKLHNNFCIDF